MLNTLKTLQNISWRFSFVSVLSEQIKLMKNWVDIIILRQKNQVIIYTAIDYPYLYLIHDTAELGHSFNKGITKLYSSNTLKI